MPETGLFDPGRAKAISAMPENRLASSAFAFYSLPMPLDSSRRESATPAPAHAEPPHLFELFMAFAKMSLAGFGGVLVWARRAIVEQHRWMTPDEFNEAFALCHFLPGPNIVNLSVVFGARFRGIPGSLVAFLGLIGPPVVIVTTLAAIYAHYGQIPALQRTLTGVSCAAVGLFLAVIARMMTPLLKRRDPVALTLLAAVFVAVGIFRLPLVWVLLTFIPLSIAITYYMRREAS